MPNGSSDGSITISTHLDNQELERELNSLTRKIETIKERISRMQAERTPLAEQSAQMAANLDEEKARLDRMKNGPEYFSRSSIREQESVVRQLQAEWDRVQGRVERYDTNIQNATRELNRQRERAGSLSQQLAESGRQSDVMGNAMNRASKYMNQFLNRVKALARRVFIFTLITTALRSLRTWMWETIKTNEDATAAVARLKAALLTLVQPLVNVVIPAFIAFVNLLTDVVSAIAKVVASLFGMTLDDSKQGAKDLYDKKAALEGVGSAAEKAEKSLASFDEINQLSNSSNSGGTGDNGANSEIAPDFEFDTTGADNLLGIIEAIGAALLAWQISSSLGLGLKGFLGILLAIYSAVTFIKAMFDAWTNGVTWDNLRDMLLGATGLAIGLGIALGPVAAGISLIITGILMLATAFADADKNGWNMQNTLLAIAGILATGLGIALVVGSWIPLLIAAIAALLLAIVTTFGDGEKLIDGAKMILDGFKDFFVGIFTGDIEKAIGGVGKIFEGLKTIFFVVIDAVKNMFISFLDWFDEKTGGKFHGIIETIKSMVSNSAEAIKSVIGDMINNLKQIFVGIVEFISGVFSGDWDRAWQGVQEIFKGIVNSMISLFERFVNFAIDSVNSIIKGLNSVVSAAGDFLGLDWSIPTIDRVHIPRLAAGAVIPPNREFMAILGDQKSGTNIEAPMSTIEQGVENVLRRMGVTGDSGDTTVILELDGQQFGKVTYKAYNRENRRVGVRLVEV
ncbi:hypothetical protein [Anaeromassilibacillus senegalensis]|uniref:hypothetical protein n=1 Tax=Anaeromassilibacillus senegalensis TaxID=1673717 RepID=UPI0006837313|nr:hypothetical protein [Anaeromassilibacillus senegalensis]